MAYLWSLLIIGVAWALAYLRVPLIVWTGAAAALITSYSLAGSASGPHLMILWGLFLAVAILLNFTPLRRRLVSDWILRLARKIMPAMSSTEREALEAGTVWWDGDLFSGRPRWNLLFATPAPKLAPEEQAFLDGPVEELCRMLNEWQITHELQDLPPEAWQLMKEKGFFGMIIPKRYGGLEFSALAHSSVVMKVASRSTTGAVTVMVPNSLGPAELLLHYGTEEQKDYYLPRLARGEEIPCFALTGPEAGSDASAMPDKGIVCKGDFKGKKDLLGIHLNWEKRYITLAPVATLIGLAFKLYDPDHLIGDKEDLGITVALIPRNSPGVTVGYRHNPLNIPFQNGPCLGKDVFIPIDGIIGGAERAGQGWRMLMESLAAGRSISLPALSTGAAKLGCRAIGAYARVRRQFRIPIGWFEGVEEALARMAGYAYMMDAARTLTAVAVDQGEKPAVISAIVKYHLTEHMRRVVNDAMDVQGGAGICLGPRNVIGRSYQAIPISITVEGANILTRSLIIYGQGAVRCHPYVFQEMQAVADADPERASRNFDRALFGHIGFVIGNFARALWLGLSGARLVRVPIRGPARWYCQQLTRMSAVFALVSDVAMLVLGGALKRKEKLSGRLADALSFLYLGCAVVKRFEDQGRPAADVPLLDWAGDYVLYQIQRSLEGLLRNFPNALIRWLVRLVIFPLGGRYAAPDDRQGHEIAGILLQPSEARDRLTSGIYISEDPDEPASLMEKALEKVIAAEAVERKLRQARVKGAADDDEEAVLEQALRLGVIDEPQAELLREANRLRRAVIEVDAFPPVTP